MKQSEIVDFQLAVWQYYNDYGRFDLPWRQHEPKDRHSPYKILVSELMLQQTQVARVVHKYPEFLQTFPTVQSLAEARLGEVIKSWSGLGYNRRAKYLHQCAQIICEQHNGRVPRSLDKLTALPGVGHNTAGAILAYAYNRPVVFVETNIRTVFIHHFFADQTDVSDKVILELVESTLDSSDPRNWYWALMDYGSHLKQTVGNLNQASKSYAKQSKFHGSKRQIRGQVLRLLAKQAQSFDALNAQIQDERLATVVEDLLHEKMIRKHGHELSI